MHRDCNIQFASEGQIYEGEIALFGSDNHKLEIHIAIILVWTVVKKKLNYFCRPSLIFSLVI